MDGIFEEVPYTNFHDLNLDWIIKELQEFEEFYHTQQAEWVKFRADNVKILSDMEDLQNELRLLRFHVDAVDRDNLIEAKRYALQLIDESEERVLDEFERFKAQFNQRLEAVESDIQEMQQELSDKMEFYKVNLAGNKPDYYFTHEESDGSITRLNYQDLKAKYQDDKYFLFCEWRSVTFIPSLPPDFDPSYQSEVLEFIATWVYMGEHRITCIKINSDNEIKADEYEDDFLVADKNELASKQDKLTPGENITISPDNVISASGGGGGGGDDWRLISDWTAPTTESGYGTATPEITADMNGNPFTLKRVKIIVETPKLPSTATGDTGSGYIDVKKANNITVSFGYFAGLQSASNPHRAVFEVEVSDYTKPMCSCCSYDVKYPDYNKNYPAGWVGATNQNTINSISKVRYRRQGPVPDGTRIVIFGKDKY